MGVWVCVCVCLTEERRRVIGTHWVCPVEQTFLISLTAKHDGQPACPVACLPRITSPTLSALADMASLGSLTRTRQKQHSYPDNWRMYLGCDCFHFGLARVHHQCKPCLPKEIKQVKSFICLALDIKVEDVVK